MLTFETVTLLSARLGGYNHIPDITPPKNPLWFTCDDSVSKAERELIGVGMVASVLPYKLQNLYDRELAPREYAAAILENEFLKATFLPELGGRLWSLYDKRLGRHLVYENDALIFANLALRNAWFAGGVEWNVGVRGHSYFTCDRLFTRRAVGKEGNDILRMYEYEELRGLVYCIEATLDRDALAVRITVKNVNDHPTYMYWWSNIAAEQKRGTRFFVPTDRSFVTAYRDGGFCISKIGIPEHDGKDTSDPYHPRDAIDYFFDLPEESKKWIASVEEDGRGLLQYSERRLFGRKAFLWGNLPGGHHWNEWLTHGRDYYEIQAGLNKTQFEHFPVAAHEELSWCEVYRGIDIGTSAGDYRAIAAAIDALVPEQLEVASLFDTVHTDALHLMGRGKGYLFERLAGERFHALCEFPRESVLEDERYWLDLLEGRECHGDETTAFIAGDAWQAFLEKKPDLTPFDSYTLALICYRGGDYDRARHYLEASVREGETFYSLTALALLLSCVFSEHTEGAEMARRAVRLAPEDVSVATRYGEIAIRAGRYEEFASYYEAAPAAIRKNGRIRMYVGQCLVELGRTEEAKAHINEDLVIEDFKEGEYSVFGIWCNLYRREMATERGCEPAAISDAEVLSAHPLPYAIDFRMH